MNLFIMAEIVISRNTVLPLFGQYSEPGSGDEHKNYDNSGPLFIHFLFYDINL